MSIKQEPLSREQEILAAAEKLFMERGYALTSTTEIANLAGCNQALVHYYFRTKEQLFLIIFRDKFKSMFDALTQVAMSDRPITDILIEIAGKHFDFIRSHQQMPFLVINEIVTQPDRIEELFSHLSGGLVERVQNVRRKFEQAKQSGEIRQVEFSDLVVTMVSLNGAIFIGKPIVMRLMGMDDPAWNAFLDKRREENIRTILNYLRP